jgi:hypothetical protein
MPLDQPEVTENAELATAEFAPTAKQTLAIQSSCIANALTGINGLSNAEKDQLRTEVAALQSNLSTAIDLVKKRRARMSLQKKRLADERALIGESQSNFSKFYAVAARAVANCDVAAKAAQDAKSGVDMVFSKETEIKYREGLLSSLETKLNGTLTELESAMDVLDTMVLAIS